jgi:DNA-binding transcriptional LysR family regulator
MQIELLETFLDLMETQSFNRSAERLGVTQSTVSSRIVALETALERKLFTRSRAGTQPTPAGRRFVAAALSLRQQWNETKRALRDSGNFSRSVRIGMQHDLAGAHIGDWISGFRSALSETAFYVELDYSNQMSSDLLSGELDVAIMFTPRPGPDLYHELVGQISYRMISDQAHGLADIRPETYIRTNYSPAFDRAHRLVMPDTRKAPLASGQDITVCGMLGSLGGTAYVLETSARGLVRDGRFRLVADAPPIAQDVFLSMHARHRQSLIHKRLARIVQSQLAAPEPRITTGP